MKTHSLITTLISLRGNPRGCVYTEPLWGIPFNLYSPYISVYMLALGLTDQKIGLIVSIGWAFQIFMALVSGAVTDKLGRRRTTLIFDILSWVVPALISAFAQNFWWFLAAALFNSFWRIANNSWPCLLVEDADPNQLVDIFTWIYIANLLVGLFAPLAGLLIGAYGLVPTMRVLYLFAAFMFTVKILATYRMTTETRQGSVRMEETRTQSIFTILKGYRAVFRAVLGTPQTLYLAALLLVTNIASVVSGNFWAILVTQKLQVPDQSLAIFPFVKSAIMLAFFFAVIPLINRLHFRLPLMLGFLGYIASLVLLITAPVLGYVNLLASVFLEALSFATVSPLIDKLTVLSIDAKERARILSILWVIIILITSPFGWIAGNLSAVNKILPFVLNLFLFGIGTWLAYHIGTADQARRAAAIEAEQISPSVM